MENFLTMSFGEEPLAGRGGTAELLGVVVGC